jgi:DNA mismatch repair protein MutS
MQRLLPGLAEAAQEPPGDQPLLPPPEKTAEHPLFTTLRDLDTNHLTPMKALALITEWKLLWFPETEKKP